MASYKVNPDITEQENFVTLVNISNNTSFKPNELTTNEKWATLRFANELSDVAYYQKVNELKNC